MEDEKSPLSRRVPGAARAAPTAPARPVLAAEVLARMRAAIDAERAEAAEPGPDSAAPRGSVAARIPAPASEPTAASERPPRRKSRRTPRLATGASGSSLADDEPVTEPLPRIRLV